jgi:hypothetical protein
MKKKTVYGTLVGERCKHDPVLTRILDVSLT